MIGSPQEVKKKKKYMLNKQWLLWLTDDLYWIFGKNMCNFEEPYLLFIFVYFEHIQAILF